MRFDAPESTNHSICLGPSLRFAFFQQRHSQWGLLHFHRPHFWLCGFFIIFFSLDSYGLCVSLCHTLHELCLSVPTGFEMSCISLRTCIKMADTPPDIAALYHCIIKIDSFFIDSFSHYLLMLAEQIVMSKLSIFVYQFQDLAKTPQSLS